MTTTVVTDADVDECKQKLWRGYGPCHKKADCTNTIGSYECTCKEGYTGNGKNCRKITEGNQLEAVSKKFLTGEGA